MGTGFITVMKFFVADIFHQSNLETTGLVINCECSFLSKQTNKQANKQNPQAQFTRCFNHISHQWLLCLRLWWFCWWWFSSTCTWYNPYTSHQTLWTPSVSTQWFLEVVSWRFIPSSLSLSQFCAAAASVRSAPSLPLQRGERTSFGSVESRLSSSARNADLPRAHRTPERHPTTFTSANCQQEAQFMDRCRLRKSLVIIEKWYYLWGDLYFSKWTKLKDVSAQSVRLRELVDEVDDHTASVPAAGALGNGESTTDTQVTDPQDWWGLWWQMTAFIYLFIYFWKTAFCWVLHRTDQPAQVTGDEDVQHHYIIVLKRRWANSF